MAGKLCYVLDYATQMMLSYDQRHDIDNITFDMASLFLKDGLDQCAPFQCQDWYTVMWHYNRVQYVMILYTVLQWQRRNINHTLIHKSTKGIPCLTLVGELLVVHCKDVGENIFAYNCMISHSVNIFIFKSFNRLKSIFTLFSMWDI